MNNITDLTDTKNTKNLCKRTHTYYSDIKLQYITAKKHVQDI